MFGLVGGTKGTGDGTRRVPCPTLPGHRRIRAIAGAFLRAQPRRRSFRPSRGTRRRADLGFRVQTDHPCLDQLRASELLPTRRRSCAEGYVRPSNRCLRADGLRSFFRTEGLLGSSRSTSGRGGIRPLGDLHWLPSTTRRSTNRPAGPRPASGSGRFAGARRVTGARVSPLTRGASGSDGVPAFGFPGIQSMAVSNAPGGLRASSKILTRCVPGTFGAHLLGECLAIVADVGVSNISSRREPPNLGAGTVNSSRCRSGRSSTHALLCWRAGLPCGIPCGGRGRGMACRLARSALVRPLLRVLLLAGRSLLAGGHARTPPNRVRWVGTPDRVESRFGWVLPGCGIAKRPLPRLIHRRCFTVLCWSRDGTAPAPLARG
jgi:hypothetical protein